MRNMLIALVAVVLCVVVVWADDDRLQPEQELGVFLPPKPAPQKITRPTSESKQAGEVRKFFRTLGQVVRTHAEAEMQAKGSPMGSLESAVVYCGFPNTNAGKEAYLEWSGWHVYSGWLRNVGGPLTGTEYSGASEQALLGWVREAATSAAMPFDTAMQHVQESRSVSRGLEQYLTTLR